MSYAAAYLGTKPVIRLPFGASGSQGVRPADWLDITMPAQSANRIEAIHGITDEEANYASVQITTSTGNYTVDWGDGTGIDTVTSGTKIDHLYDWNNPLLGGVKSDGMKQARVIITPVSGNFTVVNFQVRATGTGLAGAYSTGWLDVAISGPSINSLVFGGITAFHRLLRRFRMNTLAVDSFVNLLSNCLRLVSLSPLASSVLITNMSNMFNNCSSLQSIPAFPGSVAAVRSMFRMFQGCSSLQSIPAFPGSVAAATDMGVMFANCSSLQSIPAFPGSVAAVTNMSNMFQGCRSLKTIPAFPGSVAAVVNMFDMFQGCSSLQSIPAFPGSVAAVRSMVRMFQDCSSLQSIPAFPGSVAAVTNMSNMFNNCSSLQSIPIIETSGVSSVANANNMFSTCPSLAKARTDGLRFAISYNGCKLTANSLNDIFTGLGTAAGATVADRTIDVRNNIGSTTCNTTIATAKGWTVQTI
jgi:hypothetical protein